MRQSKVAVVVAALAMLTLAGCGSSGSATAPTSSSPSATANGISDKTADQILTASVAAAKAQQSVHIKGQGSSGGQKFAVDLQLRKGGGGQGSITIGANTIQLVSTGATVYIKADAAYWTQQSSAAVATLIGDRWVKAPATNSGLAQLAQLADFDTALGNFLKPDTAPTKGDVGTADGQPAIALVTKSGKLWVATTGEPLPIRIDTGTSNDALTFSEWGATLDIAVPKDSDTLDISKLASAG
jgi:uncharacterized protein YceK